jgi:ABC-type dipeptide/oligopeptide/nickel transport system permease subunit
MRRADGAGRLALEPRLGAALLAAILVAATAGAALWPHSPERTLEPAVAALAPPGARFEVLRLADGRRLAAARIEARGDRWLLHRRGTVEAVARSAAAAGSPVETVRFWLGSDRFGRDVAARLLHGARLSLAVAAAAVLLALGIGVPLGLAAGLARGLPARLLFAVIETAQAFPRLFLVVALAAVVPPRASTTVAILGLTGWMPLARLVRAEARRVAASDYVTAARAIGASQLRVAFRHVLPGALAPVGVEVALAMAGAVAGEAALSFLGLGAPPPVASWGGLIADGRDVLVAAPWISVAPGLALALAVLGCNLLAEHARETLDPRRATLAS